MLIDSASDFIMDKSFHNQSGDRADLVFYIPYANNFDDLVTAIDNLKPQALITKTANRNIRDKYNSAVYELSKDGMIEIVSDDNNMKILKMY